MKVYLAGFKELSLIDYPDKPSCVFWFAGCNFRCPYCYNYSMWKMENWQLVEISKLKELMRKSSVLSEACKVTGGEPTLQPEALIELGREAHRIGMEFGIDTNGSNPSVIRDLLHKYNCLDALAIDIKAPLTPEDYSKAIGINVSSELINKIEMTLREAFNSNVKLEIRIPLIPSINDSLDSLRKIASTLKKLGYLDKCYENRASIVLAEVITEESADPTLKKARKLDLYEVVKLASTIKMPNTFIRHRKLGGKVSVYEATKSLKL
ncbi:MAG: anaerobic ribonucleoside-triphosphate reductase activating protein [Candidatus Methanomethylicota archaeon]|uniref:Anaerobic ribonucleoside-triphosphate reductase activating protein n=1 Tax=Thermoproteota archaeon TaxID=2056631 RepID=A0A497EYQ2_9CREN|nr:MAG: anaerobic ribonucleoside-triphosphate reductase activating protein [Candidatus Verstraetearchaeota archaeon]